MGNVWTTDQGAKKDEKNFGLKLYLNRDIRKMRNVNLVKNRIRKIENLRIGFLEYFVDTCWVREFKPGDYKNKLKEAKKETDKARRILKNFKNLDILVCHQPPYGVLDKMMNKQGPKQWYGKHAGSKVILDYVKRTQPRYVFCGHMHESKGKKKIEKTEIYNAGCCGDYVVLDIE
ncbi:metallophosphoesterase [Candidatus Pacearchaeota archaeon]|nr:metallophosphoesterase [Candidatus Pacearchaeota archaeon]